MTQGRTGRRVDVFFLLSCQFVGVCLKRGETSRLYIHTHAELTSTAPRPVSVVVPAEWRRKKNRGVRDPCCEE